MGIKKQANRQISKQINISINRLTNKQQKPKTAAAKTNQERANPGSQNKLRSKKPE